MVTEEQVRDILKIYEDSWVNQDTDKILSIFTEEGIYHERVLKEPYVGHKQIAEYWNFKVCEEQSKIEFKLLNYYISNETVIAEWDVSFNNKNKNVQIHMKEVAIIEIKENKINSLREYWQSEELPWK